MTGDTLERPEPTSEPPTAAGAHDLTVYFDGSCPLCSAEIGLYARNRGSGRLRLVDAADPGTVTGADLPRDRAMRRFHVRRADGRLVHGARAFVAIWEVLPAWRPLARLSRLPGVLLLLEGLYRLFLPVRPVLSRLASALGARPMNARPMSARGARRPAGPAGDRHDAR